MSGVCPECCLSEVAADGTVCDDCLTFHVPPWTPPASSPPAIQAPAAPPKDGEP